MAPITRILCPVDFSEASRHAIEHATAIARWYKASITALHVYNPMFMPIPGLPPRESRVPEPELTRVHVETTRCFEDVIASGVSVDVVVDVGQPAAQILVRSDAAHSDLIVMGTHGTSGFEHLLLGSVTEKVLRRAVHGDLTYRDGSSSRSDRDRSSRAERCRRNVIRFNDKPDCAARDVPGPNAAQSTD